MLPEIRIPSLLLPADGRFGSGPTRIRDAQLTELAARGRTLLGTSHRQPPVKNLVAHVQSQLSELFTLPHGYEVVLGNGGSTTFWDVAAFSLIEQRSQHLVFGAFSQKFAQAATTPFLAAPRLLTAAPGSRSAPEPSSDVDAYAWPHNETSTGVSAPVTRVGSRDQLVLVDATSAAGALPVNVAECDVYYFAPQKAFGSDGGLWFAIMSPAAVERAQRLGRERWIPASLRLDVAVENSRSHQTINTPALATLQLMASQLDWLVAQGGLDWATGRVADSAARFYRWAEAADWVQPFVTDPACRSACVATVEVDPAIDASVLSGVLRANGVVDLDPYRGIGRNQLRVGFFPSVDPADVDALTGCLDHVAQALRDRS